MLDSNYSVDILVNDKPIRKIPFNGKLFVEARPDQEYSIRIKNNTWNRILAITSVDGLDVLTGKQAEETGNGYVINGYNSLNLDGFRVSDNKVAKFVFDYKQSSYAASKEDGSERNVGVIGARIFQEKIKPAPVVVHHYYNDIIRRRRFVDPYDYPIAPIIWSDATYGCTVGSSLMDNEALDFMQADQERSVTSQVQSKGFDMGTKFGEAKESKVINVEFERGILAFTTNIYYASRQSLIEMGVPIGCEKQVNFPNAFADGKYATPPKNWRG